MGTTIDTFETLPPEQGVRLTWPTDSRCFRTNPEAYFARTRANPDYGKPGWTRDCGDRFHKGCDIAPANCTPAGTTARVVFTDCRTKADYESEEPVWIPHDRVFCVFPGVVDEVCPDPDRSDYGIHLVVRHAWPRSGTPFFTLYAHLESLLVDDENLDAGCPVGIMGCTSRSEDARLWMSIAPHLHFEVWNQRRLPYDPVQFLSRYLPPDPSRP